MVDIQPLLQDITTTELTAVRNKEPTIVRKCLVLFGERNGLHVLESPPTHITYSRTEIRFTMSPGNEAELKVSSLTFDLSLC